MGKAWYSVYVYSPGMRYVSDMYESEAAAQAAHVGNPYGALHQIVSAHSPEEALRICGIHPPRRKERQR